MMKDSIGIDVSKDHLDVHCLGDGRAARFGNDVAGFRKLKAWLPEAGRPDAVPAPLALASGRGLREDQRRAALPLARC